MKRRDIFYALAIFWALLLVILFIFGVATLDGDVFGISVTRAVGSAAFVSLILADGKNFWLPRAGNIKKAALFSLPAFVVAVNNLPIIPLLTGGARVTGGTGDIALLLLECLLTGLFEETAYRGIITTTALELSGGTKKRVIYIIVIASTAFGLSHLFNLLAGAGFGATIQQVGYSTLIGAMCAVVMIKTRSLILPIIIHSLYNFCGYLIPRLGEGTVWTVQEIILTAVVAVTVALFYIKSALDITDDDVRFWCGSKDEVKGGIS